MSQQHRRVNFYLRPAPRHINFTCLRHARPAVLHILYTDSLRYITLDLGIDDLLELVRNYGCQPQLWVKQTDYYYYYYY